MKIDSVRLLLHRALLTTVILVAACYSLAQAADPYITYTTSTGGTLCANQSVATFTYHDDGLFDGPKPPCGTGTRTYVWHNAGGDNPTGTDPTYAAGVPDFSTWQIICYVYVDGSRCDQATADISLHPVECNTSPVAEIDAPSAGNVGQSISFDANDSTDSDGSIVSYSWDFGDGHDGAGVSPSHSYSEAGDYTVILTVTDNDGGTDQDSHGIEISEPVNEAPKARFTYSPSDPGIGEEVRFTATFSRDSDGRIVSYEWSFGDGSFEQGVLVAHTYASDGTYTVALTVTDNDGASDSDSTIVQIDAENSFPEPAFVVLASSIVVGEEVAFDPSLSGDHDGEIVWYGWDWNGDGSVDLSIERSTVNERVLYSWDTDMDGEPESFTEELECVRHVFSESGTYHVTLTVFDDEGAESRVGKSVVVMSGNELPIAVFTWQARSSDGTRVIVEPRPGDGVQFDASGSNDEDGEIAEYAWDWDDDGTYDETTLEPVIDYWFETPGSHVVTLCVTDDQGATDTTIRTVVIVAEQPPTAAFSYDPAFLSVLDVVQFTDLSYDEDGEVTSWTWDFGDGTASTEASPTHQYASKGTFTVTLRVTDDDGLLSTVAQTVEIVNLDPLATFTLTPEAAWTKQPIHLDASASSDPDGTIVAYEWDFDDDGAADASGATVETQYADAGTHTIRLYVTDEDGGTAAKEIVVTVEELSIVEPQEVWALVIGISDYEDPNVTDLAYARADAEAFATWLVDSGTDPDHVFLLLDENGETAEGIAFREATLSKIRAGLDWLYRMAHPEDLVFVYFAGHGFQSEDDDGDETDGVDEFLVPYDVDTQARSATALRDDEFGKFLDDIESNHVMVVFDSCHSGGQSRSLSGGTRPMGDEFDLFNDFSLEGKLVMAAAAENQKALEHEAFGHGVFTYFLLQGLEGGADQDVDHLITAEELHNYVRDAVEEFARITEGHTQVPQMTGRGAVGVVLGRTNRPPEACFSVTPEEPYAFGETQFVDESTDDGEIVEWMWDFGDGSTSNTEHAMHVFEREGTYTVTLTVTDDQGAVSSLAQDVLIQRAGEVTASSGDTVIISLGSVNGVEVGDPFDVLRVMTLSTGQVIEEYKATLSVIEIVDLDRAACRVENVEQPISIGDIVRPKV